MTSSAKQTKKKAKGGAAKGKKASEASNAKGSKSESVARESSNLPAYATAEGWGQFLSKNPTLIIGGTLLLTGWIFSLQINRWRFTVPVVALWLGWLGVLMTVRFLWGAGVSIASEGDGPEELFDDIDDERLKELLDEKRSLLRAIKEIEFDRDLGKMSAADAQEIMKVYRVRAIEVIKKLDGLEDTELSVSQRIERELKARLDLEKKTRPKKRKEAAAHAKAKADDDTAGESKQDAEPAPEEATSSESDAKAADADSKASDDEAAVSDEEREDNKDKKDEVEVSAAAMKKGSSDEASVMDDAS